MRWMSYDPFNFVSDGIFKSLIIDTHYILRK